MSNAKDALLAAGKAAVSTIPVVGPFAAEFIGLAQDNVINKRLEEWIALVDAKLNVLQNRLDELSSNEFYVSVIQKATTYAMQSYEAKKRRMFGNVVYNAANVDLSEDKQMRFIALLDQYTLLGIKLLKHLSINRYHSENYVHHEGMMRTTSYPGTEHFLDYLRQADNDFSDSSYIRNICNQLIRDGLVNDIDYRTPEHPQYIRAKRTTELGDEFLAYIEEQACR